MLDQIKEIAVISAGIGGFGVGIAAIIRAWFNGKATLIRARRGDPEPPNWRSAMPAVLGLVLRKRKAPDSLSEG